MHAPASEFCSAKQQPLHMGYHARFCCLPDTSSEKDSDAAPGGAFALLAEADEEGSWAGVARKKPAAATKPAQKYEARVQIAASAAGRAAAPAPSRAPAAGGQNARAGNYRNDGRPADYYRAFQRVFVNDANGEVVMRFHQTDIVRIKPNGDVILTTGTYFTATTLQSMNDALYAIDMEVESNGPIPAGRWFVVDNHGNRHYYQDNMTIPGKGEDDRQRGRLVLQAYGGATQTQQANRPQNGANQQARAHAAAAAAPAARANDAAASPAAANGNGAAAAATAARPAPGPSVPAWGAGQNAAQRLKAAAAGAPAAGGLAVTRKQCIEGARDVGC